MTCNDARRALAAGSAESRSLAIATPIGDDASFVVAAVTDAGPDGRWAEAMVAAERLAAPLLVMVDAET